MALRRIEYLALALACLLVREMEKKARVSTCRVAIRNPWDMRFRLQQARVAFQCSVVAKCAGTLTDSLRSWSSIQRRIWSQAVLAVLAYTKKHAIDVDRVAVQSHICGTKHIDLRP